MNVSVSFGNDIRVRINSYMAKPKMSLYFINQGHFSSQEVECVNTIVNEGGFTRLVIHQNSLSFCSGLKKKQDFSKLTLKIYSCAYP